MYVCSLVEVYRRFRGACCLHHQGDEVASTSETSVNLYQTTRRNNPEESHLHTRRRENLKSYSTSVPQRSNSNTLYVLPSG
jgi:hypothetical protein